MSNCSSDLLVVRTEKWVLGANDAVVDASKLSFCSVTCNPSGYDWRPCCVFSDIILKGHYKKDFMSRTLPLLDCDGHLLASSFLPPSLPPVPALVDALISFLFKLD